MKIPSLLAAERPRHKQLPLGKMSFSSTHLFSWTVSLAHSGIRASGKVAVSWAPRNWWRPRAVPWVAQAPVFLRTGTRVRQEAAQVHRLRRDPLSGHANARSLPFRPWCLSRSILISVLVLLQVFKLPDFESYFLLQHPQLLWEDMPLVYNFLLSVSLLPKRIS